MPKRFNYEKQLKLKNHRALNLYSCPCTGTLTKLGIQKIRFEPKIGNIFENSSFSKNCKTKGVCTYVSTVEH